MEKENVNHHKIYNIYAKNNVFFYVSRETLSHPHTIFHVIQPDAKKGRHRRMYANGTALLGSVIGIDAD